MASQATIDKLAQQILAQGTKDWSGEGFGSAEANAKDMARILAEAGITDISQFGVKTVVVPAFTTTNPYTDIPYEIEVPATTRQAYVNKVTGEEIMPNYDRAGGNIWSGTFSGKGSTNYGVNFDAQGNPKFFTQYGGTTSDWNDIRDTFVKPALIAAGAYYAPQLFGSAGAGAGTSAAAGDIAFAAADAAQLAAQGLSQGQIAQVLASTGLDSFVAADMASLAAQGLGASQIAQTVGATAAGTGGGLFGNLGAAETVAQGVAQFPTGSSAVASPTATPPASAATTPAAATSGLTSSQIANLAKAGLGLLGAGGAGAALSVMGGSGVAPSSLPQQQPAAYDQNYFDALNKYYGTYFPGQEANTSMLSSWYNRQPYQTEQFQMPVMAQQVAQQQMPQQQPTQGENMGFFSDLFKGLFGRYFGNSPATPSTPTTRPAPMAAPTAAPSPMLPPSVSPTGFAAGPLFETPYNSRFTEADIPKPRREIPAAFESMDRTQKRALQNEYMQAMGLTSLVSGQPYFQDNSPASLYSDTFANFLKSKNIQ